MNGIIFFDGVCNLCNSFVQFVIERDTSNYFKFCSLQSDYAQNILKDKLSDNMFMESVVFFDGEQYYTHSDAVLNILKKLNGMGIFYHIIKFIPKFFRDWLYKLISKYRYKIWGKQVVCLIPSEELLNKFIA